jgi:hypothetical protein
MVHLLQELNAAWARLAAAPLVIRIQVLGIRTTHKTGQFLSCFWLNLKTQQLKLPGRIPYTMHRLK